MKTLTKIITEAKPKCFGTLKPITGSCVGCALYQSCLEDHMGITVKLSEYRRET